MSRKLMWRYSIPIFLLLVAACNSPSGNKNGALIFKDASGRVITRLPLITSTPSHTPTPIIETGKGELYHFSTITITDSNKGEMYSNASGTIPFTIAHNAKRGVWEVKGSYEGAGLSEYNASIPAKIYCSATWSVDLTLSGILVPPDTLIADKAGCWMQLSIEEDWSLTEASCSTHLGNASGIWDSSIMNSYGPLKFELTKGVERHNPQSGSGWTKDTAWKIETLELPLALGCGFGSPIDE